MNGVNRRKRLGKTFRKYPNKNNIVNKFRTNLIELNTIHINKALRESYFFKYIEQIIPPTILTQTSGLTMFGMKLGVNAADAIGLNRELNNSQDTRLQYTHNLKILLRMCKVDGGVFSSDKYPKYMSLKVNNQDVNITKGSPTDITPYIKINPTLENNIEVIITRFETSFYIITVFLGKTQDTNAIVQNLLAKKIRCEKYTHDKIKELLSKEDELELTSMDISLKCPLSQTLMINPCQSDKCNHLDCFEAENYLRLNLISKKWICPICKIHAAPESLVIDGYLLNALKNIPSDCTCLTLNKDGSCVPGKIE